MLANPRLDRSFASGCSILGVVTFCFSFPCDLFFPISIFLRLPHDFHRQHYVVHGCHSKVSDFGSTSHASRLASSGLSLYAANVEYHIQRALQNGQGLVHGLFDRLE